MKRGMVVGFLVVAMVFGVFAYAYAVDSDTITVTATIKDRIELTLTDTAASLVLFDPLNETATDSVTLNVRSNVPYTVSMTDAGGDDLSVIGFSMTNITGDYLKAAAAAGRDHTVDFDADVSAIDWPDADTLTHSYYYTVVQDTTP